MKVGIIIPLKAKIICKDWLAVSSALEATVSSVLNQSNQSYRLAVIGHDCPATLEKLQHDGLNIFTPFDELQPPNIIAGQNNSNQLKYELDRCSKILKGIQKLKQCDNDITHWFALDADDLLHNDFVYRLTKLEVDEAALIENGYFYYKRKNFFNITNQFYIYCGSSAVLPDTLFKLPSNITPKSYSEIPFGYISHVNMKSYLIEYKIAYSTPQQKLVMYVRDNGDNISANPNMSLAKKLKKFIQMLCRFRYLSSKTKSCFGITKA